jgi:two-component system, chemotaxis family, protein-glutamate methylesterase/glutaminase
MRKTRVLVVDDSVVARQVLTRLLAKDSAIEVVGTAANGRIALAKIEHSNPDVVTLDVEMPEMNGLETLAIMRKTHPLLPAIMFSIFTAPGSEATLRAMAFPPVDYVTKPSPGAGPEATEKVIREDLLPRIKRCTASAMKIEVSEPQGTPPAVAQPNCELATAPHFRRVDIVVVGVSTGGPDALADLLPYFPQDFAVPILIVQHMPALFTQHLAERLAAKSNIPVAEGRSGQLLLPGHAWLAPGDFHMRVAIINGKPCIQLDHGPRENSCRPSVDILFRSASATFGPHVLAVVMTGMGQDGFNGCEHIHAVGGRILVQDEASSVVWGMPGAIVSAGLGDEILSLRQLGPQILRHVSKYRDTASSTDAEWEAHSA